MGNSSGKKKKRKILILGLDDAGKTTTIYRLKQNTIVNTISTIGFNVEKIEYNSLTLIVWDLSGQRAKRPLWTYYSADVDGIVFVVDSADEKRLTGTDGAKYELETFLSDIKAQDMPLLVLANKQDKKEAIASQEVEQRLKLSELNRTYKIFGCSAVSGEDTGIEKGISWLAEQLKLKQKGWTLFRRRDSIPTSTQKDTKNSHRRTDSIPTSTQKDKNSHRRTQSEIPTSTQKDTKQISKSPSLVQPTKPISLDRVQKKTETMTVKQPLQPVKLPTKIGK